jgi:AcrR family transcriptional regulator
MASAARPREALLAAALDAVQARGAGVLNLRQVAAAADVSTMGVYTHFGSKQRLLEALYLHGFALLGERLRRVPTGPDARAGLIGFSLAYRSFGLDYDALYALMFEGASPDFQPSDSSRQEGLQTFDLLTDRVRGWCSDPLRAGSDAHLVWAALHGLTSIELMHRRWNGPLVAHLQGDPEANFAASIARLLDALTG